ncbi:MAG: redoxin domain-containing protein [Methanosarcinaceae archaeon]
MKKVTLLLIIGLYLFFGCSGEMSQRLVFTPEKPGIGQTITVQYNPKGTALEKSQNIQMEIYEFSNKPAKASGVSLAKSGDSWQGSFTLDSATVLVILQFESAGVLDNNKQEGYQIQLNDKAGKPLRGSRAALAGIYARGAYPLRLERDREKALNILMKEFTRFPTQKEKHLDLYFELLLRNDRVHGKALVAAELDSVTTKSELTLDEKKLAARWYSRIKQPEKADKFNAEVRIAEPKGDLVQHEQYSQFYREKDPTVKLKLFKTFQQNYPESRYVGRMASILLRTYIRAKEYDKAQKLLEDDLSAAESFLYNSLAWELVEKETNLSTAVQLAKKGVDLARKEAEAPASEKPPALLEKQWRKNLKRSLGNTIDTYAFALYKTGQVKESLELFKEAVELTEKSESGVNERCARILLEQKENETAFALLDDLLRSGKGTQMLQTLFQEAYVATKGSDAGLDSVLAQIQEESRLKLKEKLKHEMIEKNAPDFSLVDLDSQTVSLKELRGKIVVLDFWATWCAPCLQSFPGMQKVVEKFKTDEEVAFLFMNTWERGENLTKKLGDFIQKNNYSFHVLLDSANTAVADYKVEGIPTKFIVDKNGTIRFKSVGFSGNAEELVDELSIMIDMLR